MAAAALRRLSARSMRAHGSRDAFYIATKAGLEWNERGVFANSTPARLRRELEDSLRRLGTDYIDLYQIHWPDTLVPVAEVAGVLAEFQRDGKVRALGVSNFSAAQMEEFRSVVPLASDQPPYNIFERDIDRETLPWCAANGVSVLTYSSLCRSLLGGRLHRGMQFEPGDIRAVDPKFQEPRFSQYMTAVERSGCAGQGSLWQIAWRNWRCAGCWIGRGSPWRCGEPSDPISLTRLPA